MAQALLIDTCGEAGYVALVEITTALVTWERRLGVRATQEELLPAVASALTESALRLTDLAALAIVSGPGSFTGVRIGLATAKGLCEAAGVPLIALSRLDVLASAGEERGIPRPFSAWLQAGRGDVYAAGYTGGSDCCEAEMLLSSEQAVAQARGGPVLVVETALAATCPQAVLVGEAAFARALASVVAGRAQRREWSDAVLADGRYIRVPDAELALRLRQV